MSLRVSLTKFYVFCDRWIPPADKNIATLDSGSPEGNATGPLCKHTVCPNNRTNNNNNITQNNVRGRLTPVPMLIFSRFGQFLLAGPRREALPARARRPSALALALFISLPRTAPHRTATGNTATVSRQRGVLAPAAECGRVWVLGMLSSGEGGRWRDTGVLVCCVGVGVGVGVNASLCVSWALCRGSAHAVRAGTHTCPKKQLLAAAFMLRWDGIGLRKRILIEKKEGEKKIGDER